MRILGLLFGLSVLAGPLDAGVALTMEAPAVMLAPGHLVVHTLVEPDAANRAVQVVAESSDFYRSSEVPLDGDSAPRRSRFEFRDLPTGSYEIQAVLLGSDGQQRALVSRRAEVVGRLR